MDSPTDSKTAGVVVAAGYGVLELPGARRPIPKTLAEVDDAPMALRVAQTLYNAGCEPIILVVNPRDNARIVQAIVKPGVIPEIMFVGQETRSGAADAVRIAFEGTDGPFKNAVIAFGDMPLWEVETVRSLIEIHEQDPRTVLSFVIIPIDSPSLHSTQRSYGHVMPDGRIVEPGRVRDQTELAGAIGLNPSLYVLNRGWYLQYFRMLKPCEVGDGYPAEYELPSLVGIATMQGRPIGRIFLQDPSQALGVNTLEELFTVRSFARARQRL